MQKLYEGVIKLTDRLESKKKYTRFNIFMLGDMVSGIIHEELLRHKGLAITDQVVMGAEIIADFIYKLKRRFPTIDVYCVVGNHGRLDKKISFKDKWNSFDYLLYKFIETKFENVDGVNFYIPKQSMIIVKKFDFNFLLRHGDGKSNSFAGIPVYGIMRTSAKATQMFAGLHNTYIHYEILGHYHTPMALPKPAGKIIINGTLKGTDEYGLSSFLSSDVSQKLLVLNSKHGIFANIDIYCEWEVIMEILDNVNYKEWEILFFYKENSSWRNYHCFEIEIAPSEKHKKYLFYKTDNLYKILSKYLKYYYNAISYKDISIQSDLQIEMTMQFLHSRYNKDKIFRNIRHTFIYYIKKYIDYIDNVINDSIVELNTEDLIKYIFDNSAVLNDIIKKYVASNMSNNAIVEIKDIQQDKIKIQLL